MPSLPARCGFAGGAGFFTAASARLQDGPFLVQQVRMEREIAGREAGDVQDEADALSLDGEDRRQAEEILPAPRRSPPG